MLRWSTAVATLGLAASVVLWIATISDWLKPEPKPDPPKLVIGSWSPAQPSPWQPSEPWIGPLTNNRLLETMIVDWDKVLRAHQNGRIPSMRL